jgi:V8-like Glu-specific endopeptidase
LKRFPIDGRLSGGGLFMSHFLSIFLGLFISFSAIAAPAVTPIKPMPNVIYGTDDRKDLYQVTNPFYLKLADSTVALFETNMMSQTNASVLSIDAPTLIQTQNVCSTEPFATQPAASFCSGSLIGPHLMLTAGHCIATQDQCNTALFVFGDDVDQPGVFPYQVQASETYQCKSILYREQNETGADFGIIEIDRDVPNHTPLTLANHANPIANGTKLLCIGHPSGLPTKIDDGGIVRDGTPNGFFVATTDSFGGNSGSPVINQATGQIEGVLVRGANDYVRNGDCNVSNVYPENGGRGEDVTKASSILPILLGIAN